MPAHNPVKRDTVFDVHIAAQELEPLTRVPDGHITIWFEWKGGNRTWDIEGVLEPESPFLNPKHNKQVFENGLPKSQGEVLLRFLRWVQSLTAPV